MRLIPILIPLMAACNFSGNGKEPFTIEKSPNTSNSLLLSGFYYCVDPARTIRTFFLYADGILLHAGDFPEATPEEVDKIFNDRLMKRLEDMELAWGLYQIIGDSIVFEQLHPSNGYCNIFQRKGVVINDSTFRLTETVGPYSGLQRKHEELYRFRRFKPKPDSTNQFIK